ncbi:DUF4190 domain-containing protein [Krasilnikoviella flava]|uniref:DUF4190 domain-containing protein n=1 Tax=Krasilnikoviella flava TaxID=526729 RepID=A0A1T5IDN0_9MICO|nr:DUF4190 domain-containing protein [Krasilnikoviella flava]SKC37294.1 protein of unknown function [Krasilnikoviella flava]
MAHDDGGTRQQAAPDPFAPPHASPASGASAPASTPDAAMPYASSPDASTPYASTSYASTPYASTPYASVPQAPAGGTDGVSIAALVTGVLFLGVVPLVLGIVGLARVRRSGRPGAGLAVAGIVLGALSTVGWVVGVVLLGVAVDVLEDEGVLDDLGTGLSRATATEYGDDPYLDGLYDDCAGGDDTACDDLYWESGAGTAYEEFALSCGGREDRCLVVIGEE